MASTFHQFSRLPVEVRLQIWEEACFPRQSRGLHYATLDATLDATYHFVSHHFPGSRSAYSWDGGLWMACKESRVVLEKHHFMKEWKESELADPTEYQYSESWMGSEKEAPGLVAVHDDHQVWHCVVYPARDIFCVTAYNNDWESVMESWPWHGLLVTVPFIEDFTTLRVDNIALEFDPIWNLDLPTYLWQFDDGKSSRGFLARMLVEKARGDSRATNIWLIDNNARWQANSKRKLSPVVYGCDREYIEVGVDDIYIDGPYKYSIKDFIRRLVYDFDYDDDWPCYYSSTWESEFSAKETIRLLVRRDNQMTKYLD
ncbi:tetracycline resistance [Fusarium albosuccineum]|uniref:Tetracycline resistance n=1 Tax=Fusarium albosuccineum TaxID=1237068 RepID=A0A8H4LAU7_9HYPO|nr:tetracycline resistance [Fusarium albosuccineum]